MRLVPVLFLMFLVALGSSCSSGCGCSAYYEEPKDGGEIQVQFRVVMAETVGGHTDCGYKDVPTRVTEAKARGEAMREIVKGNNDYRYAAPKDFDPSRDPVSIVVNGTQFDSRPDSVKRMGDSVFFDLR